MRAYLINLDRATERRRLAETAFQETDIELVRVVAIEGAHYSPSPEEYDSRRYRLCHGKRTNPGEVGCYLSHIKALRCFLDTPDEHAIILEDDARPLTDLSPLLDQAVRYGATWDILRLSGLHHGAPAAFGKLGDGYRICVNLSRQTGAAAYMVNRKAASVLIDRLLPMWLPYDHAFDREWFDGLTAACIHPFPVTQSDRCFTTQIDDVRLGKYPALTRYRTVFPYRAWNESCRVVRRCLRYARLRAFGPGPSADANVLSTHEFEPQVWAERKSA